MSLYKIPYMQSLERERERVAATVLPFQANMSLFTFDSGKNTAHHHIIMFAYLWLFTGHATHIFWVNFNRIIPQLGLRFKHICHCKQNHSITPKTSAINHRRSVWNQFKFSGSNFTCIHKTLFRYKLCDFFWEEHAAYFV